MRQTECPDYLERSGRVRALLYKTLFLTGLRKGELGSLTMGQVRLDADPPHLTLAAADEKNRRGSLIPLRADLTDDLRTWLRERLDDARAVASQSGGSIPDSLSADEPLFHVPLHLVRNLKKDLRAAGIPHRDERGHVVDVHALRHTFGTMLAKGGVMPRVAQELLRHSDPRLTANVYTHLRLAKG
jgi:integrase